MLLHAHKHIFLLYSSSYIHIFVTEAGLLSYCGAALWGALRPPIAVAGYWFPECDHAAVAAAEAAAVAATAIAVAAASMQQAV